MGPSKRLEPAPTQWDGSNEWLDRQWTELRQSNPRVSWLAVLRTAARTTASGVGARRPWRDVERDFLRGQWHRSPAAQIARALGRTVSAVDNERKRLGIGRYAGGEYTIRALETLTGVDHRQWLHFIEQGWLRSRTRSRSKGAAAIRYVSIRQLHALLAAHPEVFDYRRASNRARTCLELDKLAKPPGWKRVRCESRSRARSGSKGSLESRTKRDARGVPAACAAIGGVDFWAPVYALPQCPRCGRHVSRYAPHGVFTDVDPGDDERLDVQARKLGLRWVGGAIVGPDGRAVDEHALWSSALRGPGRRGGQRGLRVFEGLLAAGVSVLPAGSRSIEDVLPNILDFELRQEQEDVFQALVAAGALTSAHAMSFGKSTLGLMLLTRIAGSHLLMVDSALNAEQWISKMRRHAPRIRVRRRRRPACFVVTVFDRADEPRCDVHIYNYLTRADLSGPWDVAVYDEVQRLPSSQGHRHALARSRYRMGASATATLREDGRGALVAKMTGEVVGDDWAPQLASGLVRTVPVVVKIVDDIEHKHEVVGEIFAQHAKVVVLCEALRDGLALSTKYGVPFVNYRTANKLEVLHSSPQVVASRTADTAISLDDCEVTVDHSGLFGSRGQSVQRLGRLLHSQRAVCHVILMTREERERFGKRVDILREKGFLVREEVVLRAPGAASSPAGVRHVIAATKNPYIAMLGWAEPVAA